MDVNLFAKELVLRVHNNQEPLYGLHYNDIEKNQGLVRQIKFQESTLLSYYDHVLHYTQISLFRELTKGTKDLVIITKQEINLSTSNKIQRISTQDFEQDKFALSTVLSTEELTHLQMSVVCTDFPEFQNNTCVLRVNSILDFYNTVYKSSYEKE